MDLWAYFCHHKMAYFPVTVIELCPDRSFIMTLTLVGVSLPPPPPEIT